MANDIEYFADSALVGHLLSATILAKLVDRGVISVEDATDVLDETLLELEELQSLFPEHHRQIFEFARDYLSRQLAGYGTIRKEPRE